MTPCSSSPRSFQTGSGKDSGHPWSPCRESPHREGVGPAGKPSVAAMSAAGPAPLAPTYAWCQSCGLRYALALPKCPRLCYRCGGSNPKMGVAPQKEARQERTDHRYFGVPPGRPPGPIPSDPSAASGLACASSAPHWKARPTATDGAGPVYREGRRCSMTSIEIRGVRTHSLKASTSWTWERANRTLALSTASAGRCPCAERAPGPDRLAVRRCLPDCRNARIPVWPNAFLWSPVQSERRLHTELCTTAPLRM